MEIALNASKLSKKDRIRLKHQQEKEEVKKRQEMSRIIKWGIIGLLIISFVAFGWWVIKESSKPLPGLAIEDQGRQHISRAEWEKFKYNSNPPTSGPHDADWIKTGIYDTPQGDGNLVHSLEHGYVVISYNCSKKFSIFNFQFSISKVYAHGTEEEHAKEASDGAKLEDSAWKSKACEDLKKQLTDIAKENKLWKLIVVPRPNLDTAIALTAWTRIDRMDKVDKDQIRGFIEAYRDHGPEQTME